MNHILNEQEKAEILEALNQAADHEVWEKSNFLRVIGKQVAEAREDFKQLLHPKTSSSEKETHTKNLADKEQTAVFISVYCTKGSDLKNWERVLSTLPTQLTSRPIYTEEEHVIELIKSKSNQENEAYLCINIPSQSVVPMTAEKTPEDKLGHPLVTLRGKPIPNKYQAMFIHESGKYQYLKGRLIHSSN